MANEPKLKIRKHFLVILLAIVVVAALVFQGLYDWHIHNEEGSTLTSTAIITDLIDSAISSLVTPAPVDAQTGNVYFPDAKLMLPMQSPTLGVKRIEYNSPGSDSPLDLQVTTFGMVNEGKNKMLIAQTGAANYPDSAKSQLTAILKQVPHLQACVRGVQLFYHPQKTNGSDLVLQFTKKLNNGKTLYAYNETACNYEDMPALVTYLKQIQSY